MTTLTKNDVIRARAELEKALRTASVVLGIDFKVGKITYTSDSFRCKLDATVRGAGGASTKVATDPHYAALLKAQFLLPVGFSSALTYKSDTLGKIKFVGYNTRAHAYPFIVQSTVSGKKYKLTRAAANAIVERGDVK